MLHRLDFVNNLKSLSEPWVDGLISKCRENLENELEIHDKRFKEILEVYEIRIKELLIHNKRLEEHKKVIFKNIFFIDILIYVFINT